MGVETVFLLVLVIALVIGNALISFVGGRKMSEKSENESENPIALHGPNSKSPELLVLSSQIRGLQEKLSVMNKKLASLEGKLEGGNVDFPTKEKLRKLDHFRASALVEIQGLKEMLFDMQKQLGMKSKKHAKENEADISGKDMHDIIYRTKK